MALIFDLTTGAFERQDEQPETVNIPEPDSAEEQCLELALQTVEVTNSQTATMPSELVATNAAEFVRFMERKNR